MELECQSQKSIGIQFSITDYIKNMTSHVRNLLVQKLPLFALGSTSSVFQNVQMYVNSFLPFCFVRFKSRQRHLMPISIAMCRAVSISVKCVATRCQYASRRAPGVVKVVVCVLKTQIPNPSPNLNH